MAEERFKYGIDPKEIGETLTRLGEGIGTTVFPQQCIQASVSSTEDWEIKMITVMYAEKVKKP